MKRARNNVEQLEVDADPLAAVSEKARKFLAKNMQKAINLFRTMDTSGDGLIDQNELKDGLKKLSGSRSQKTSLAVFGEG